jgi:hypothetical protein
MIVFLKLLVRCIPRIWCSVRSIALGKPCAVRTGVGVEGASYFSFTGDNASARSTQPEAGGDLSNRRRPASVYLRFFITKEIRR